MWFTQEGYPQAPGKVNYDTLIVAANAKGSLVEILVQGHFREFAVDTKWVNEHTLNVLVDGVTSNFALIMWTNVDVEKKTAALVRHPRSD